MILRIRLLSSKIKRIVCDIICTELYTKLGVLWRIKTLLPDNVLFCSNLEMDLQCLASWRDGSQTFLIGQTVETSSVTSAIVQYRCFVSGTI